MSTAVGTKIIPRSEWGARAAKSRSLVNWPAGVDLWVHHTVGFLPADDSFAAEAAAMRAIQAFHQSKWSDIGYGYGGFPSGRIYEGRGFEVHGAHSPGRNHEPSMVMVGNYQTVNPTALLRDAVFTMDDFLDAGDLRGHRENSPTTCPGDRGMSFVVNAVRPEVIAKRPRYYFEELPHTEGGLGPVVVGQAAGYAQRAVMIARREVIRLANPTLPLSTLHGLLGQDRQVVPAASEDSGLRYFILSWAKGAHGQTYRFGPWRSAEDRDAAMARRERNTGRKMRPFNGRSRSLYPWAIN